MKIDKQKNNILVKIADEVVAADTDLCIDGKVNSSYNGQISALGVMIAMVGLNPALCLYNQEGSTNVPRRNILSALAKIIAADRDFRTDLISRNFSDIGDNFDRRNLYERVIHSEGDESRMFKTEILNCIVALKQVVRTYLPNEQNHDQSA